MINPFFKKLREAFGQEEDSDKQITEAGIEEELATRDEVVGLYVPDYATELYEPIIDTSVSGYRLPIKESARIFYSIEEMAKHIKEHGYDKNYKHYFFDRNDEEVRQRVLEAIKEKRIEDVKEKISSKSEDVEGLKKKLERLNEQLKKVRNDDI